MEFNPQALERLTNGNISEFARTVGIDKQKLAMYIAGICKPSCSTLEKLFDVTGKDPNYFFDCT